ncbi:hypothetical protein ACMU_13530 [Actibacterium mucosum KCTC 23349]|uniref:Putative zinc-finger domain-containing protein n=1 Tax=Actibacterium mucosum KCTC 23349 TaxID=1454373 RepID=A0A037ZJG4_9RHOB|nr:anti-sigma factor [Actibacterium mucosum]KAJ55702.1 hypothetical protein ACMU_13530 [Actibacterium mucosum KCTC 23349]
MSEIEEKLSAYLDGELSDIEAAEIERRLSDDADLRSKLEMLMEADAMANVGFDDMLTDPVPLELAAAIKNAAPVPIANEFRAPKRGVSGLVAASAVFLVLGLGGGYFAGREDILARDRGPETVQLAGWLGDVMSYHGIYAAQNRHLVEVPASDADHLQSWLNNVVQTNITIPDLQAQGLTFRGGRLLAAAGKPVGQLMYTDAEGNVVALCFIRSETPHPQMANASVTDFDLVSWGGDESNFVVIGPAGYEGLDAVAAQAALDV